MTIDTLKAEELPAVWNWLVDDAELHLDDFGPKTFEEFLTYLTEGDEAQSLVLFAVRKGKKLVGSVGFSPAEKTFRGIVFDKSVQGSGTPVAALRVILLMLWKLGLDTVTVKYFIHNKQMPGFLRKLGAQFVGLDGHTTQGGVPVQYVKAIINAPTDADVRPAIS